MNTTKTKKYLNKHSFNQISKIREWDKLMDYYDYPETTGMSFRDRKISLLQHQQRILKEAHPTEDMLRFQQRVLREKLLAPSPMAKGEKMRELKAAQHILKDLERVEREKLKKEKQLKDRLKKADEKIRGRIIKETKHVGRYPFY